MRYLVHRIKDAPRESFRWAPHMGGLATVKIKDYDQDQEVEAPSSYAAWKMLAERNLPLRPGDILECFESDGRQTLQIAKYIGFEPAQWFVPEAKQEVLPPVEYESRPNVPAEVGNNPA